MVSVRVPSVADTLKRDNEPRQLFRNHACARQVLHQPTTMHTILGANGTIGHQVSLALPHTTRIRQVGRHPERENATDQLFKADLLDAKATEKAVAGSEVVYLLAGLKYNAKVWQEQWPRVMRNTIDACKRHQSKLIFFDNVYPYGKVQGTMTETTPFNPCSKKGEVRATIATMLLDEMKRGELTAMIVRSADFYGPGATLSITHSTVTERLRAKKTPQWLGDPKAVHTFTYTPDAARTMVQLATTPSAYGQTWHALTSKVPMTGEQYVRIACELAGQPYGIQRLGKTGVQVLGLFMPVLREVVEMMYQSESDYRFDSSKVEQALGIEATGYSEGIAAALAAK